MANTEKKWEFRTLNAEDVFPMLTLINKIGFKEFKNCFNSDEIKQLGGKGKDDEVLVQAGMGIALDIAGIIISNISKCESDIFGMLSNVSNLEEKDIRAFSMSDFAEMIIDFVKKPEFSDFFKVVSKLLK